jgi:hypothetical protein
VESVVALYRWRWFKQLLGGLGGLWHLHVTLWVCNPPQGAVVRVVGAR